MGEVYAAEECDTGRWIALKVLRQIPLNAADRVRFLREGRLAAAISHPHVVYVFGSIEVDGVPAIAMELVPGGTLKEWVQANGPLAPPRAVDAVLQLIAGLDAAARAGILHRDIKPSNGFVDAHGDVKIGDFGLSISTLSRGEVSLTETGRFLGTPMFAAPEQLRRESLDVRSDIYAVGATLFYLLTGHAPIEDADLVALVARIADEPPPTPRIWQRSVSDGLADVVCRCLAKERANRFATYAELADALQPFCSRASGPPPVGRRVIAGLIDFAIIDAVTSLVAPIVLGPFVARAVFADALPWLPNVSLVIVMSAAVQALVCALYFGLTEGNRTRSVGKLTCGLRVVSADGTPLRASRGWTRAGIVAGYLFAARLVLARLAINSLLWPLSFPLVPMVLWNTGGSVNLRFIINGGGLYPLALAALFVTARRDNGWIGLHERLSSSRVSNAREEKATAVRIVPPVPVVGADGPRVGSYVVLPRSAATAPAGFVVGYDEVLLRHVWIRTLAVHSPPVSPARRDLSRPTRIRWLGGKRSDTEAWDAYEAAWGEPAFSTGNEPWPRVRDWIEQLASEVSAGVGDGTLPPLTLNRIWIGSDDRARLLDWPANDNGRANVADAGNSIDDQADQAFLANFAASALEGRPIDFEAQTRLREVPLSASCFLSALHRRAFANARAVAQAAASLSRSHGALAWRRAAHLSICTLGVFLVAGPIVRREVFEQITARPQNQEIQRLQSAIWTLVKYDNWERQSASALIVERRQALETYIRGRFAVTMQRAGQSRTRLFSEDWKVFWMEDMNPRADELFRQPEPSEEDMSSAENVLQPLFRVQPSLNLQRLLQRERPYTYALALIAGVCAIFGVLISPLTARGGWLLRWVGFAVVGSDGVEVSVGSPGTELEFAL